jgi:hypothetical protein
MFVHDEKQVFTPAAILIGEYLKKKNERKVCQNGKAIV